MRVGEKLTFASGEFYVLDFTPIGDEGAFVALLFAPGKDVTPFVVARFNEGDREWWQGSHAMTHEGAYRCYRERLVRESLA
ncbi:hypothetical protein ABZ470_31815 [Streptosporangium sp. NPDC020072]|uniref:hypothetical protein n=1 Tax=Streptosporangium sp. NPDC020072 TaxID=3154788 RepID=UPI003415A0DB